MGIAEKKTLVIGASLKSDRFSNRAIKRLVENKVPVVAVGLREGEVHGVGIQKPFPEVDHIHTVTMYIGPKNQPGWYDFILKAMPVRVIFNPGTYNADFVLKLKEAGIEVVEDCTLIMLSAGEY